MQFHLQAFHCIVESHQHAAHLIEELVGRLELTGLLLQLRLVLRLVLQGFLEVGDVDFSFLNLLFELLALHEFLVVFYNRREHLDCLLYLLPPALS